MRGAAYCACVLGVASQARQLSCVLQQQRDCQTDRSPPTTTSHPPHHTQGSLSNIVSLSCDIESLLDQWSWLVVTGC